MAQQTLLNTKTKSKTNSLLELCKLFFAFVVLKSHGLTPIDSNSPWITTSALAVEFFFVSMGWFLIKSLDRHQEQTIEIGFWRGWWQFFKKKMLAYLVPCLIPGIIACLLTVFYADWVANGVLCLYWFIHDAFVVMFVYYAIFYKVKNKTNRLYIMVIVFVVTTILKFVAINYLGHTNFATVFPRDFSCFTMGMLCSLVPIKTSKNKIKILAWLIFVVVFTLEISLVILPAKIVFGIEKVWYKDLVNLLLFPAIIWSCFWVNFSWKPLNYVGKWSRGLYLWQMMPFSILVIGKYYNNAAMCNPYMLMSIVIALTIIEDPIRYIIKRKQNKKIQADSNYLIRKESRKKVFRDVFWSNKIQIILFVIAIILIASGSGMGLYGLIDGIKNGGNMNLFVDPITHRNTMFCRILMVLLSFAPIVGIFPINHYLTNRSKQK